MDFVGESSTLSHVSPTTVTDSVTPQAAAPVVRSPQPSQPAEAGPISCIHPQSRSDPEKAAVRHHHSERSFSTFQTNPENEQENASFLKAKALRILLYLSGPALFFSIVFALWAFFVSIICLLLQPFAFILPPLSPTTKLISLISPPLRFQLNRIYHLTPKGSKYSPVLLVIILLLSPLFSIAIAIASWTAGVFWIFACLIGDPEGADSGLQDRRTSLECIKDERNDGRESVLVVRSWWRAWLTKAIK